MMAAEAILAGVAASDPMATLSDRALFACADTLALDLAGPLGCTVEVVTDALCTLPDNMLSLLDSPQGWSALAQFVAGAVGAPVQSYQPTVH